eukprot:3135208-Alexandrium_andersonii.AAC.1
MLVLLTGARHQRLGVAAELFGPLQELLVHQAEAALAASLALALASLLLLLQGAQGLLQDLVLREELL